MQLYSSASTDPPGRSLHRCAAGRGVREWTSKAQWHLLLRSLLVTSNKCHATSNKCLTSSNKEAIRIKFKVN